MHVFYIRNVKKISSVLSANFIIEIFFFITNTVFQALFSYGLPLFLYPRANT